MLHASYSCSAHFLFDFLHVSYALNGLMGGDRVHLLEKLRHAWQPYLQYNFFVHFCLTVFHFTLFEGTV